MDKYRAKTAKASSESTTTTAVGEKKLKQNSYQNKSNRAVLNQI